MSLARELPGEREDGTLGTRSDSDSPSTARVLLLCFRRVLVFSLGLGLGLACVLCCYALSVSIKEAQLSKKHLGVAV